MIPVKISSDAIEDLDKGFLFYEAQESGLGGYFVQCLQTDIDALHFYAGVHRIVYRDYHRTLSKTFPYGIFYTMQDGVAVVWAVLDLRRDPDWILKRLSP